MRNKTSDNAFIFTGYRSASLEASTIAACSGILLLGLAPGLAGLVGEAPAAGFLAVAMLVAGLLYWGLERYLLQDRALSRQDGHILQVTCFARGLDWRRVEILARDNEISGVFVRPVRSMLFRYQAWLYQIVLRTVDGREIVMANDLDTLEAPERSLERAQELARELRCEVPCEPEAATEQEVGLFGRLFVTCAVFGLIWGLYSLMP